MLGSGSGVSSKRVITTLASLLVFIVVCVDLFSTKYAITDYVFEGLIWMVMAGLGSVALESFSTNKKNRIDRRNYRGDYEDNSTTYYNNSDNIEI